jgi:hypothetical protein
MTTFRPSCREANSSSSMASSGVYIGMIAAGMMRSAKGRNCSAVNVVGAAKSPAQPLRLQTVVAEAGGGIDHAEIEAEVIQALVHEARKHGRGPVEGVLGGEKPERLLADPPAPPLGHGHAE